LLIRRRLHSGGALAVFGDGAWLGRMMLTLGHPKKISPVTKSATKSAWLSEKSRHYEAGDKSPGEE